MSSGTFQDTIDAVAITAQIGHKVHLIGPPGGAKSAIAVALANAVDAHFVFLGSGGQILPESISLPVPPATPGAGVVMEARRVILAAKAALAEGKRVIIMADEISRCLPSGRNALLAGLQEGRFGDEVLDVDRVSWIVCSNPTDTDSGTWEPEAAFANRVTHLKFEMPLKWWSDQALAGFPAPQIRKVPDTWRHFVPEYMALTIGFLNVHPAMANAEPKDEAARGGPWPSYRSHTNAWHLRAACKAAGINGGVEFALVAGTVGEQVAMSQRQYEATLDLPDPEELLANPTQADLPKRGDLLFVTLSSVTARVLYNNTVDRWCAAWEVFARAAKLADAGIAAQAARTLASNRPVGAPTPDALRAFLPILGQAGITKF